jgi:HPt (histidine-containing phosphotransfer) domain-containing protein
MQTLAIFLRDGKEKLIEANKALNANDSEMYVICVHALKGALTNIGALKLSMMAKNLENAGRANDLHYIQSQNGKFLYDLEIMLNNVANALNALVGRSKGTPVPAAEIITELSALKTAIDSVDPSGIKSAVKNVQPFTQCEGIGGSIQDILMHVLVGEYSEAIAMIDDVANNASC